MAIPTTMADLSTTAASNSPAGSENPSSGDDFLRAVQAIIRTTNAKGSDIASATTTDIGAATAEFVDVTGTTTITGLGTIAAGIKRLVRFTGILTLTHNGTSLILPSSANITTANGDFAEFRSLGSGNWGCTNYARKDGSPVLGTLTDTTPLVKGSSDATKLWRKEVDTNVTTATTVVETAQNVNGTTALVEDQILPINAVPAASAMTITINPCSRAFRSATLGSGTVNVRAINTAITTVISSGSTGGTVSANPSRIAVLAMDNAGTIEAAWCNASGSVNLDESTLISTTAEGGAGAADSANVIYSTTARSNLPFRIIGYFDSTQATAGTWATAPSTIQGNGGNVKVQNIVSGAPVATTSGTSFDFTVPAFAKRITITLAGVSHNAATELAFQLGDAGGIETTGYLGTGVQITGASANSALSTTNFKTLSASAAAVFHGAVVFDLENSSTNTWACRGQLHRSDTASLDFFGGSKPLSQPLTTIRMTTGNGTAVFDAGEANDTYE